ncbi:small multidrug resistance protein [Halalkalicoccus jeotgali B3]|uniref:Small multidrug resistance protein n=1 Tax=Halalkalicoccus jeotgali (strain DSM 18796 / CECT 7217 / JCM 14584 / KCTC 4019 / B3) TaxID=795797 RepID=D8JCL7_HALJB|nr:multidrug efflux SMR transporter [Halalkalicoccus jeotgali]ADJ17124.1 small multidrug resistance protein [Halalkalicoccus jeotgali B3]ELY41721.1 small multidrug resistance protein [Halalkalicoccus jeotgali B3]
MVRSFVAGLFEIAWAIGLEYSDGLSEPLPTVGTVVALIISMVLLAKVVQDLPIGTVYAVWTGIGAVGTASLGIIIFDEPATSARLLFISVIIFGSSVFISSLGTLANLNSVNAPVHLIRALRRLR